MANYLKVTNFAVKDGLTTSDPNKIVKGSEINFEFDAIQTSVNGKADLESPVFTGAPKAPTAPLGTETTQLASTLFVKNAIDAIPAATTVGTLGTQDKDAVDITGGTVVGLTQLEIDASARSATQTSLDVPSRTGAGASGTWNISTTGALTNLAVTTAIKDSTVGQIGTYAFLKMQLGQSQLPGETNNPAAGNQNMYYAGIYLTSSGQLSYVLNALAPGTWRAMGMGRGAIDRATNENSVTLYLRII